MSAPPDQNRPAARARRRKAVVETPVAEATVDKGLLLVLTGNGKGKSSSAFGMMARALGHGMRVGIVQFIKGSISTGERVFFRRFPEVEFHVMGEGFTGETPDREDDIASAQLAWETACRMLRDPRMNLVVLDELTLVLKYGYLSLEQVLPALTSRPPMQHVIITGRGASPELIVAADTVTEMRAVKHAFEAGIQAQQGIEL